jgi:glycosyltransferase involved in cell wall biosynthesis
VATVALIAGFAESLVLFRGHLIRTLAKNGHRVIALAPPCPDKTRSAILDLGAQFVTYPMERRGKNVWQDARTLLALGTQLRRDRPDLVLAYTIKPVAYGLLAAQWAGIPRRYALITGLGTLFPAGMGNPMGSARIARRLYQAGLRGARNVIFQNDDDQQFFRRQILSPETPSTLVHGSGVDVDWFQPVPFPIADGFLMVGRILRSKGVVEFVEAARIVHRSVPDAAFELAGWYESGTDGIPESQVKAWEAEGLVRYRGVVEDVRDLMAAASIYVLPSYREGMPRSVLEAMAMGRPVITTDVPGCRQTIQHGEHGLLVPPGDPRTLAGAMLELLRNRELCLEMGRRGRERTVRRYDVRLVTPQLLSALHLDS